MNGIGGRRRKHLLGDLKERRGYWKLKEEGLVHIPWRTRFGRGYGPVIRQTTSNKIYASQSSDDANKQKPFCTFLIAAWSDVNYATRFHNKNDFGTKP